MEGNSISASPMDCAYGTPVENCTLDGAAGGFCDAGYVCDAGSSSPQEGGLCPANSFCEAGPPGTAVDCPAGKYQELIGETECKECLAGHFCAPAYVESVNGTLIVAEAHLQACPNGTYNPLTGSVAIDACLTCPGGYVCGNAANATVACPPGYYCPEKTTVPTLCPPSFYCSEGSRQPRACPADFYCPEGASEPVPCAGGTYCPRTAAAETLCPAGKYSPVANLTGNILADGFPCLTCPAGHYCLEGSANATICPEGFACLEGSSFYEACPRGFTCPEGSSTGIPCEAGYYCPLGTDEGIECPQGTFCTGGSCDPDCTAGSYEPEECPLGTWDSGEHLPRNSSDFVCQLCPAGTAGERANRSACDICEAGYVCLAGCTSTTPTDVTTQNGYACPAGFYCPEGSSEEIPCPAGKYNSLEGGVHPDDCVPCPVDYFAENEGSAHCRICGGTSKSEGNSTTCTCLGSNRAYQTKTQSCTCIPHYEYRSAEYPFTLVSDEDGSANCTAIQYPSCTGFQSVEGVAAENLTAFVDVIVSNNTLLKRNSDGNCVEENYCPSCAEGGIILGDGLPCACAPTAAGDAVAEGSYCNGADHRNLICDVQWRFSEDHIAMLVVPLENGTIINASDPSIQPTGQTRCGKSGGCSITTIQVFDSFMVTRLVPAPLDILYDATVSVLDYFGVEVTTTTSTTTTIVSTTPNETTPITTAAVTTSITTSSWNVSVDNATIGTTVVINATSTSTSTTTTTTTSLCRNNDFPTCDAVRSTCGTIGDGFCDPENNFESCGWDGGDCVGVPNALMCVEVGDGILFEMPGRTYPVYVRDSLLNTNPAFDYSEFALMGYNAKAGEYDNDFLFFFDTEGTYVFASSGDLEQQTIVKVGDVALCSGSGTGRRQLAASTSFSVISFENIEGSDDLYGVGIVSDTSIEIQPDWLLVAGTGGGLLFIVVVAIILLLVVLRSLNKRAIYKQTNDEDAQEADMEKSIEEMVAAELRLEEIVAERELESKLSALISKLRHHTDRSKDGFGDNTKNLAELTNTVRMESEVLRKLLAATILERGDPGHTQVALRSQIEAELGAQAVSEGRFNRQLLTLVSLTTELRDRLDAGASVAARRIIQEMTKGISANGSTGSGVRLKLDNSDELEAIDDYVRKIVASSEKLKGLLTDEKARSEVNESLFNTARYTHILPPDGALSKSLSMLTEVAVNLAHERESLSDMFTEFSKVAKASVKDIATDKDPFEQKLVKAVELHNPGEVQSAKRGMYDSLSVNLQEIRAALVHLFQVAPKTRGNIQELGPHANACRDMVRDELDSIEEEERLKREQEVRQDAAAEVAHVDDKESRKTQRQNTTGGKAALLEEDPLLQQQQHTKELQQLHQQEELMLNSMVDEMSANMDFALDRALDNVEATHGEQKSLLYDAVAASRALADNEELRNQLVAAFEADMSTLSSTLEHAKAEHLSKLQGRLADRAARKSAKAKQRQDDEKREIMLIEAQKDELEELHYEQDRHLAKVKKELADEAVSITKGAIDDLHRKFDSDKRSIQNNYDDERIRIAEEHFNEVAKMLGLSLDLAHEEEARLKERMALNRQDREDRLNREFEAKMQVCQNKIDAFDRAAYDSDEEADEAIQALEREKVGLQLEWESALQHQRDELDSEERRVTQIARDQIIEKNRRQLEEFDEGVFLLADQAAELDELKRDYDMQFEELASLRDDAVAEKTEALASQIDRRQAARLERVKNDHLQEERQLKRRTNVAITEVQNRLAVEQDNWWWEGNINKAMDEARKGGNENSSPAVVALAKAIDEHHEAVDILHDLHNEIDDETEALFKSLHQQRDQQLKEIDEEYVQTVQTLTQQLQTLQATDPVDEAAVAEIHSQLSQAAAVKFDKKNKLARENELKRQQHAAMSVEKLHAAQTKAQADNSDRMWHAEVGLLRELIADKKIPQPAIGPAIQMLLEQRHATERAESLAAQFDEKSMKLSKFLQQRAILKQTERLKLCAAKSKETSPDTLRQLLREFDAEFDAETMRGQQQLTAELTSEHEREIQNLQKQQMAEMENAFKELAPTADFQAFLKLQSANQGAELSQFRMDMEQQKLKRLDEIEATERSSKAAIEAKQRAELDRMEADALQQLEKNKKLSFERIELQKQKMAQELEETHRRKLAAADGDEAKELVMEQFRKDWHRIERTIQNEKRRQEKQIKEGIMARQRRLRMRKEKELQAQLLKQEQLAAESRRAVEAAVSKTIAEKQAAAVEIVTKMANSADQPKIAFSLIGKLTVWARKAKVRLLGAMDPEARRKARIQASNALRSGQTSQPVPVEVINETAKSLQSNDGDATSTGEDPKSVGNANTSSKTGHASADSPVTPTDGHSKGPKQQPQDLTHLIDSLSSIRGLLTAYAEKVGPQYEDPLDKTTPTEGVLQPKPDDKLDRQALLSLRYCRELASAAGFAASELEIRAASKLPHNEYKGNCYRNSFFLQSPTDGENDRPSSAGRASILYLRETRLASAGDATTVAAHCLAHISAGDRGAGANMCNDEHPRFKFHFLNNIRILGQSMYEGGLRIGATRAPIPGDDTDPDVRNREARQIQERMEKYVSQVRAHNVGSYTNAMILPDGTNASGLVAPDTILSQYGAGEHRFVSAKDMEKLASESVSERVDASVDMVVHEAQAIARAKHGVQQLQAAIASCESVGDVVKAHLLRLRLASQKEMLEDLTVGQEMATVFSDSIRRSMEALSASDLPPPPPATMQKMRGVDV